ncbi:HAMP domain-containing sensor histidine kinase [Roseateles sp. SL47]|uniref:sensor histidine kinase n=1 Tax=Roseateles sp. SL47 TaxID=2995138 RepID=UPI00226D8B1A|nr:HAMP domain-containing sensor histidine kinase [Roseateles sp. SL47]WAC71625.1 HAMP domain-containing sensor histidine kinase [Roseateles sp. SL47]
MFRSRVTLALAAMLVLVCIQAGFVYLGTMRVESYTAHSRLTSDLLSELLDLSADKQRLRTWAAQQTMGVSALPEIRERLLDRMSASAERLTDMSRRNLASWREIAARDDMEIPDDAAQLVEITSLLGANITELRTQLRELEPHPDRSSFADVWRHLNQVFDTTHGRDLRDLLNGAIDRQRQAVPIARAATENGIHRLRLQAVGMVGLTFGVAVALYVHLSRRLRRPLDDLLAGTQALQAGRLEHRIPVHDVDEFGRVAAHFNAMAHELQQHRAAMDVVRRRLEDAVKARTQELEQAHGTLQQLDQRRRQLFADLGHELRTPATVIRGEADIALRSLSMTGEQHRMTLQRIVAAVKQLTSLVDDLLLVARAEADELDILPERLALGPLLADTVAQAQALATLHGQRLETGAIPNDLTIDADPTRLRQALMIVLDNAIRYSRPQGRVRVACAVLQEEVELSVTDEGIGISEEELTQVFDRFVRGPRARRHRADGTGIGLSIARTIMQAHGGHIDLHSEVDRGTTVRMRLPLASFPQS